MKKITFTSLLVMATILVNAQGVRKGISYDPGVPKLSEAENIPPTLKKKTSKAFLDTIMYEDFANAIPAGWTVTNNTGNSNQWIWSNTAPGGQYSTNIPALSSTSSANGYMSLPSGLFNTPFPPGGLAIMDTWFTSPVFSMIPPNFPGGPLSSVVVKFEHSQRYCCSSLNELVLEVSDNGTNWTAYDATGGRSPNTLTPNGEVIEIIVSDVLRNQNSGYIRFRSTGNSHYYWMIDDVLVYQGPENNMRLSDWEIQFHDTSLISPLYTILPVVNVPPTTFFATSWNAGGSTQTNVDFNVDIYMNSSPSGGPGAGLVYSQNDPLGASIPSLQFDDGEIFNPFFSFNAGFYSADIYISSDSINQIPLTARNNYDFELTLDTTVALDRDTNGLVLSGGPANYVGGGQDNDALGALMLLDSNMSSVGTGTVLATSISIFIANRTENDGVSISPRVWPFNQNAATLTAAIGNPVASSPFSETITTAMLGTWVTIPFFPPATLGPGSYYFGVEQTGGGLNGDEIWVARDLSQEEIAPVYSTAYFLNEPGSPRWIAPPQLLLVRFNGTFPTDIVEHTEENTMGFELYPNPNNGLFTLEATTNQENKMTIMVRNSIGQIVMSEHLSVNGQIKRQIDLTAFEKGIYFITLDGGEERAVKKVVVK